MFENVGRKLKIIAIILFAIEVIAAVITAICVGVNSYEFGFLWFLLITIGGTLYAYLSVLAMYALGEAADKSTIILQEMKKSAESSPNLSKIEPAVNKHSTSTNYGTNTTVNRNLSKVESADSKQTTTLIKPTSVSSFEAGQNLTHKNYGFGRVVWCTREEMAVIFESEEKRIFKLEEAIQEFEIIKG